MLFSIDPDEPQLIHTEKVYLIDDTEIRFEVWLNFATSTCTTKVYVHDSLLLHPKNFMGDTFHVNEDES